MRRKVKNNSRVNGGGQECPPYTNRSATSNLEPLPKKLHQNIADQRGDHSYFKICGGENISEGPD
jgi:hypothetical protein